MGDTCSRHRFTGTVVWGGSWQFNTMQYFLFKFITSMNGSTAVLQLLKHSPYHSLALYHHISCLNFIIFIYLYLSIYTWSFQVAQGGVSLHLISSTNEFNTLRPRQNGRHFPDDIFKWIFLNENVWISIEIPVKFVPKGQINNIPAFFQIMAWRRQAIIWNNDGHFIDAYMLHSASMS